MGGEGIAQLWYSAVATDKYSATTLYLKSGSFQTEAGSIIASKSIRAYESLEISAFPNYGQGKASFWYAAAGKEGVQRNTLYLRDGDFKAEKGSIVAKQGLHAGRYL